MASENECEISSDNDSDFFGFSLEEAIDAGIRKHTLNYQPEM